MRLILAFLISASVATAQPSNTDLSLQDAVRLEAFAILQEGGAEMDSSIVAAMEELAVRFAALDSAKQQVIEAARTDAFDPAALETASRAVPAEGRPYAVLLSPSGSVGLAWFATTAEADSPAMADLVAAQGGDPTAVPETVSYIIRVTEEGWEADELYRVTHVGSTLDEAKRSAIREALEGTGYTQWLRAERNPCYWDELETR